SSYVACPEGLEPSTYGLEIRGFTRIKVARIRFVSDYSGFPQGSQPFYTMALGSAVNVRRIKHPRYKWLATYSSEDIIKKKYFTRKQDAEDFADEREKEAIEHGAAELTTSERAAVLEFRKRLGVCEGSVREALEAFCAQRESAVRSIAVEVLVPELIAAKEREGKSTRYLQDLRSRLGRFARDFEGRTMADISTDEISEWLHGLRLASITETNYRRLIVLAYNFAQERGLVDGNRAAKATKRKEAPSEIGVLEVEEIAALFNAAETELVPFIALQAFGGLRRAEAERIQWEAVDFDNEVIVVSAKIAKNGIPRHVEISETLKAWLMIHRQLSGSVKPPNCRKLMEAAREAAQLHEWPQNALRHSAASYH
ncbi:MAG: tyrosine-type recombinase/integrase, partial [Verrucomicrobiales bacterium]